MTPRCLKRRGGREGGSPSTKISYIRSFKGGCLKNKLEGLWGPKRPTVRSKRDFWKKGRGGQAAEQIIHQRIVKDIDS